MKQTASMQTFRGTAPWVGSQLLGLFSKNFKEVVGPFQFVCFASRTPIFTILHILWSFCLFLHTDWQYICRSLRDLSYRKSFGLWKQTLLLLSCKHCCYSAAIQAQGYVEHLQKNAHWMQEHFLFHLQFVPSHNAWNLNASISDQVLLCFSEKYSPRQKPTTFTKPQVVSWQKMEGKAILSDAWARGSTNKCCSIIQNYLNGNAGRLGIVQTTQYGDRTLFTMQVLQDVPNPQQLKGTEMQLSVMLSFFTNFILSARKHAIKIYIYTSPSAKEVYL